jgi:hypothetical protein
MKTPVMETKWQDSKCLANIIIGARIIFGVLSALTWQQLRSCGTLLKRSTLVPCHEWIISFHLSIWGMYLPTTRFTSRGCQEHLQVYIW